LRKMISAAAPAAATGFCGQTRTNAKDRTL
jgi:hypothetical protein